MKNGKNAATWKRHCAKKSPASTSPTAIGFSLPSPKKGMLPYLIDRIGEDQIVFASDYPHWDALFPKVVSTIRGRKDISESAKEKILGKNANRLYGWDD